MEAAYPSKEVRYIRNSSCFSEEHLFKLKQLMYTHKVASGHPIYREGDLADKLYFIHTGKAKVTKVSEDGKEYIMYLFHDGDFLGQLDPYHDSKQSFHAHAVDHCEIGMIQKGDLEVLLWQHGDLAVEFMKWMGLVHRMTQTKFRDLLMYGKPGALCSTLIRMSNSYGVPSKDGILISLKVTNSELGDYIGCARESVNRMLSDLKKANAIVLNQGHIIITNLEYLQDICKCEQCPKDICRI